MSEHRNNVANAVSGTPGTGTITLASAVTGSQSFASAYGANATVDVFITEGTAWEVARNCTSTHSGTTLTRGTLEASSTGSALSLTSAAVVRVAMPADMGNRIERLMQMVTPGGRLTTESGVPVSTSDRTAQSTLYYTPYLHNGICLWDGSDWRPITFTEVSETLPGLTSARPYDVFGFLNSGVLDIELLAWTNDTTRATAVTLQDGRYCKSGDKTRLLLGTVYTTSTTATEDSEVNRYVSNVYNQVPRSLFTCPGYNNNNASSTYTFNSTTWIEANAGTGSRVRLVLPLPAFVLLGQQFRADGTFGTGGVGVNATTASFQSSLNNSNGGGNSSRRMPLAAGFNYAAQVMKNGGGTSTVLIDDGRAGASADPPVSYLYGEVMA